jgi:peptide deformylase
MRECAVSTTKPNSFEHGLSADTTAAALEPLGSDGGRKILGALRRAVNEGYILLVAFRPAAARRALPPAMTEPLQYDLTLYPSPVLRKHAEPVEIFDEHLRGIVEAMFHTMRESKGVGLAAPQVGLKRRILVMNHTSEDGDDRVMVNPEILERVGETTLYEEGCLSFPGIYAEVQRPDGCRVKWQDLDGREHEQAFEGFESRVIQHEYDHLVGVLLVDRMSSADKLRNKVALENLVYDYKSAQRT